MAFVEAPPEVQARRWQAYKDQRRQDRAWLEPETDPLTIQERVARIVAIENDDPKGESSWEVCNEWLVRFRREVDLLHHTLSCGAYDNMDDERQLLGALYWYLAHLIEREAFDNEEWWSEVWEATTALTFALTHPTIVAFEPSDLTGYWQDHWADDDEKR